MQDEGHEVLILRLILRKAQSPMWWARLSYPTDKKYWTEEEQDVLGRIYS